MVTITAEAVIDLSDLPPAPAYPTGETLRPLLTGNANRDLATAFRLHDDGKARQDAYNHAVRAARLQKDGAPATDVFKALARAEEAAPTDSRPWHAARLDAYAAAHGVRGWYRNTDSRGQCRIQISRLRLREDGDRGRYYTHTASYAHLPLNSWVIDRDTGHTVYRTFAGRIAQQWIGAHETAA